MRKKILTAFMLGFMLVSTLRGENISSPVVSKTKSDTLDLQDFSLLSENDFKELEFLLKEQQLSSQDLNFEKDWDLSTWGKSKCFLRSFARALLRFGYIRKLEKQLIKLIRMRALLFWLIYCIKMRLMVQVHFTSI